MHTLIFGKLLLQLDVLRHSRSGDFDHPVLSAIFLPATWAANRSACNLVSCLKVSEAEESPVVACGLRNGDILCWEPHLLVFLSTESGLCSWVPGGFTQGEFVKPQRGNHFQNSAKSMHRSTLFRFLRHFASAAESQAQIQEPSTSFRRSLMFRLTI